MSDEIIIISETRDRPVLTDWEVAQIRDPVLLAAAIGAKVTLPTVPLHQRDPGQSASYFGVADVTLTWRAFGWKAAA